jgi:membrane-bound lytic murein transglycosylase A
LASATAFLPGQQEGAGQIAMSRCALCPEPCAFFFEEDQLPLIKCSALFLLFLLLSCVPPPPKEPFLKEEPPPPPSTKEIFTLTDDGDRKSLLTAIDKSLCFLERKIARENPSRPLPGPFGSFFTPEKTYRTLKLFRDIYLFSADASELETKVNERFSFVDRPKENGGLPLLLTGYYEPVLEGSLESEGEYRHPIYRCPDDLVEIRNGNSANGNGKKKIGRLENGELVPYFSREEIDSRGALQGKGYELAWLKDPWERFVLHIQGSGQIRLPDGKILRVGFAGSNGRPYRGVGQYLVQLGCLPEQALSLRRVRDFIRENPEKAEEILNQNERYIFFRPVENGEGPYGSLGVSLTAGRSIATDHNVYPAGALAYLVSRQPVLNGGETSIGKAPLRRFVLNQDTGAAIKGSGRVDFFWGTGEKAGFMAGELREEGKIYFLIEKSKD